MQNRNDLKPGRDLFLKVKAAFILQDTTITQWCKANEISISGASSALIGSWNGPKGKEVRQRVYEASGADKLIIKSD
ncbi:MAG: hypothetical protein HQL54_13320 [Magnetococcales bacterium]|nr:hypothetical protein [Magnetococcales bacterium]